VHHVGEQDGDLLVLRRSADCVTGAPHSLQNLEFSGSPMPHEPHTSPAAVSAPRASSTPISCHCWSTMSVISPCQL
jgi:hypothetical protein